MNKLQTGYPTGLLHFNSGLLLCGCFYDLILKISVVPDYLNRILLSATVGCDLCGLCG